MVLQANTYRKKRDGVASEVAIEGAVVPRVEKCRYLGSIIQENGEVAENINQQIKVG